MDEMVESDVLKNILLKLSTRNILSYSASFEDSETILNSFLEKNTSKHNEVYINNLYKTLNRLRPGNNLPEIEIINFKNENFTINGITKEPTVLYFWSKDYKYHLRIVMLKQEN